MVEKVVKRIDYNNIYKDKKGKERPSIDYYLVINGNYVAIRPCFAKGYVALDLVSEVVKNGSKE